LITCQVLVNDLNDPWADVGQDAVSCCLGHVKHYPDNTSSLFAVTRLLYQLLKDVNRLVDNLLSELLNHAAHA
jgi:hypothetical protein